MTKNTKDRRVQKTRKLLQDALIKLIEEKGYESVTVQQIIDEANVGRSTFYSHYEYKDRLLLSCFENIKEVFEDLNKQLPKSDKNTAHENNADPMLSLFQFAEANHRFFKALLGEPGRGAFNKNFYDYLFTIIYSHLKLMLRNKRDSLQSEIIAHYIVNAFIGTLIWWLDKDMPLTTDEIATFFKQLAWHGLKDSPQFNHT